MEPGPKNSPPHQLLPQVLESWGSEALREDVPQLFGGGYLLDNNPQLNALLTKPMGLDSIVFDSWSKLGGQSVSQDKRTHIVFMDAHMHLGSFRC